ncbi:hypothetical protein EHS25_007683 [Saitozyma podzolica]|uniref:Brl1/Brr6 domain-containing protein n=1 Tax=Saitozyma podzolica TaxID=1890683 RepID=A0A427YQH7_9TREE|nr:hypothetical protein EHS25_007683 [Saitozyma podzolica]
MFRYQARDKSGPMDVDSPEDPLHRLAQFAVPSQEEGPARKRPHSELASPSRSFSAHPSHSPMQFGTNTPFIFHTANLPQPPSSSFKPYDPSEWTSRSFGFGPGPDTPARHGGGIGVEDVEMRWDSPAKDGVATHENLGGPSTTTTAAAIGGDGEGRKFAGGAVSRVRKKRQKEWRRKKRDSESEDDGEGREILAGRRDGSGGPNGARKTEHTYNFNVPTPGLRHSEIPALLVGYLQFFVNAAVVVFVLYLAVQFVLTVRRDVKERMQEASVEILQEIAECTKLYLTNRCDPTLRVPAMEAPCRAWEACMQRDPTVVGRTNVVAETFAGVINSFVDPISWKTMASDLAEVLRSRIG